MTYVLVETLASKTQGRTLWFKQMTGIGPMTTPERAERAEFKTRGAAERCPALFHGLSFFEVQVVDLMADLEASLGMAPSLPRTDLAKETE